MKVIAVFSKRRRTNDTISEPLETNNPHADANSELHDEALDEAVKEYCSLIDGRVLNNPLE